MPNVKYYNRNTYQLVEVISSILSDKKAGRHLHYHLIWQWGNYLFLLLLTVYFYFLVSNKYILKPCAFISDPKFGEPIANMTVAVGREAILACQVKDLGPYKVSIKLIKHAPELRPLEIIGLKPQTATYGFFVSDPQP